MAVYVCYTRFVDVALGIASPWFKTDVLLQRTVLALFSWDHIPIALQKHPFESVVSLANLQYFVNHKQKKLIELEFKVKSI